MKLSKAQEAVLNHAKEEIDFARTHTLEEWYIKSYRADRLDLDSMDEWSRNYTITTYEKRKNGIALSMCNSRTLKKLEDLGLIEILYDSNGTHYGVDEIRVLNY